MNRKFYFHLTTIMMFAIVCIGFASCSSDDDSEKSNSIGDQDPEGTVVVNIRNESSGGYDNLHFDMGPSYTYTSTYNGTTKTEIITPIAHLYMTPSNNLGGEEIVSVGRVNGLGSINKIPDSGWSTQVALNPGNGYIIRRKYEISGIWDSKKGSYGEWIYEYSDYYYSRIYCVEFLTSYDLIAGATLKYQGNWKNPSK